MDSQVCTEVFNTQNANNFLKYIQNYKMKNVLQINYMKSPHMYICN